jgi:surfactin synthase thioesterase subunit
LTALQIHAWSRHAAGDFCEVWLEGLEHNFINKAPSQLMKTIISQLVTPTAQGSHNTT